MVRDYPVSVVSTVSDKIVRAGEEVERTARQASKHLSQAQDYALEVRKHALWYGAGSGFVTGMLFTMVITFLSRRFFE